MSTLALKAKTVCDHLFILENRATSGDADVINDSTRNIPLNFLTGLKVIILSGAGSGQVFQILSNTFISMTLNSYGTIFDHTTVYRVIVPGNENYCLKCLGINYYWDTQYVGGASETVTGVQKLAQDVEFALLMNKGSSIYNSDLGSGLSLLITADILNDEDLFPYAESNVNDSLTFVMNNQVQNQNNFSFDSSELVGQFTLTDIQRNVPETTEMDVTISVTSSTGTQVPVTAQLLIR